MVIVNNKLVSLIHSFTAKEIKDFKKFICSPFFSKGRNYMPFLEQVVKLKKGSVVNDSINVIVSTEGKKLSDQTLRNRYSELYYLGEKFLAYKGFAENKTEADKILLKKLQEKKLDNLFKANYLKTLKYLHSEKFDDLKFQNLSHISGIFSLFLHDKNKVEHYYREYYNNSKIVLCINLLSLFTMGLEFSQQKFDSRTYEPNYVFDILRKLDLDDIIGNFKKSDSIILKVTSMNYYLYKAFEDTQNEDNYFEAHKIFIGFAGELKDRYKTFVFTIMINYCIKKQNEGITKYQKELFKIYNEKLSQNLVSDLKENSYLFNGFRDYVYIGLVLQEYKWVENFIDKYSHELPVEIREDETGLSYAKLNFQKKKFERSLSDLEKIRTTNYLLYLDASLMRLCNYFELARYEEAYLEIDKQKHYIKNHKEIPKDRVKYSNNFIVIYQKLLKFILEPGKKDSGFLETELLEVKYIDNREWIMKKVQELRIN